MYYTGGNNNASKHAWLIYNYTSLFSQLDISKFNEDAKTLIVIQNQFVNFLFLNSHWLRFAIIIVKKRNMLNHSLFLIQHFCGERHVVLGTVYDL